MIRINKERLMYALIFVLIAADLKCFYLIDVYTFRILGASYDDLLFLLHVMLFAITFLYDNAHKYLKVDKWNVFMTVPIVLTFLSAYAGIRTYGQPFFLGLVTQRSWIGCVLVFFVISSWLKRKIITVKGIKKTLFVACIAMLCIYVLQYVLGNFFIFTSVMTNERYGGIRFYFETAYLIIAAGFAIDNIIEAAGKKEKKKYILGQIFFIMMLFFTCAVINKGRMLTISVAAGFLFCVLLVKVNKTKKIILCFGVMIVAVFFLSTNIATDAINALQGVNVENDTLGVRNEGRIYYLQYWIDSIQSIIIGCGSPNYYNWQPAADIANPLWSAGGTARFYLVDNGIFGELFLYGLCGIAWFVGSIVISITAAIRVFKKKGKVGYFLLILADLLACITLVPNQFGNLIVFPLYLALLKFDFLEVKALDKNRKNIQEA